MSHMLPGLLKGFNAIGVRLPAPVADGGISVGDQGQLLAGLRQPFAEAA
jgi:hypothetical protein